MTTLQAFNTLLRNFMHELCQTFPEDATLSLSLDGLDALVKANARKPLELFMEAVGAHAQLILTKDPALFATPLTLSGTLDLKTYWDSPGLSDASKDAIWQYLQQLYLLGSTVSALPAEMLTAIESMAQECASKIESGEADLASVTNMLLNGGLGNLGALGGLGDLGNLGNLGGLGDLLGGDNSSAAGALGGLGSSLASLMGAQSDDAATDLLSIASAPPSSRSSSHKHATKRSSTPKKSKK